MTKEAKINLLEMRLQILGNREKENQEICRKIKRDIRKLKSEEQ